VFCAGGIFLPSLLVVVYFDTNVNRRQTMAKTCQLGLRLDEEDGRELKRISGLVGRTEQDVVRDSIRMYVRHIDEQQQFLDSVERGWYELRSGLGELVAEDDAFFETVRSEIRNNDSAT
jgi:predicted DNA-binding protein